MAKKNTIKINNLLTGKVREIALPGKAEKKPAPAPTTAKTAETGKSEGGNSGKNKR